MKTTISTIKGAAAAIFTMAAAISCGNPDKEFDATGSFEAEEITVSAEVSGKLVCFDVSEGQTVREGEILGQIDTVQLHLSKLSLEQSLIALKASIPDIGSQTASLVEQLEKQKTERNRVEKLLSSNAATVKQLDDINSAISVLESQISATESTLRNNIAVIKGQIGTTGIQIRQIEDNLSKCRITAPADGTVLSKYVHEGELAAAGRPLFKIADTEDMFLRAYFTLGQLKDVKLGQKVKVTADYGGGNTREYEGTVNWISEKSEFTPKSIQTKDDRENLVYAVKIGIRNDGFVKIGMYGEVIL